MDTLPRHQPEGTLETPMDGGARTTEGPQEQALRTQVQIESPITTSGVEGVGPEPAVGRVSSAGNSTELAQRVQKRCIVTPVFAIRPGVSEPLDASHNQRRCGPRYTFGLAQTVLVPHPSSQAQLIQLLAAQFTPWACRAVSQNTSPQEPEENMADVENSALVALGRVFTDCGYEIEAGTSELVNGDRLFFSPDGSDLPAVDQTRILNKSQIDDASLERTEATGVATAVASPNSCDDRQLPLLFRGAAGPRWFKGLEFDEDILLAILSFLVPSQDLPRLAAVEKILQKFVRKHTAQLSVDWLRRRMGASSILGIAANQSASSVDHILSVNHFEKPRLQYISYLDGTVFDTAMLEPQTPQRNRQQHKSVEPLSLEPSIWDRGGSSESAEEWASAAIGDAVQEEDDHCDEAVEPQALPESTTAEAAVVLPVRVKPKRASSSAVNSLRRRVVKFE